MCMVQSQYCKKENNMLVYLYICVNSLKITVSYTPKTKILMMYCFMEKNRYLVFTLSFILFECFIILTY